MTFVALVVRLTLASWPAATFDPEVAEAVRDVRRVFDVPPVLVHAVIACESNGDPDARSKAGAIGLMQVMPFNAARVGLTVKDLSVPRLNILAGVRLLAVLLQHYGGDVVSALVAYNATPRKKGAAVPENGETPAYVACVLKRLDVQVETTRRAVRSSSTSDGASEEHGNAARP